MIEASSYILHGSGPPAVYEARVSALISIDLCTLYPPYVN